MTLTKTRVAALARHKVLLALLHASGVADAVADAELCPPLLEAELLDWSGGVKELESVRHLFAFLPSNSE